MGDERTDRAFIRSFTSSGGRGIVVAAVHPKTGALTEIGVVDALPDPSYLTADHDRSSTPSPRRHRARSPPTTSPIPNRDPSRSPWQCEGMRPPSCRWCVVTADRQSRLPAASPCSPSPPTAACEPPGTCGTTRAADLTPPASPAASPGLPAVRKPRPRSRRTRCGRHRVPLGRRRRRARTGGHGTLVPGWHRRGRLSPGTGRLTRRPPSVGGGPRHRHHHRPCARRDRRASGVGRVGSVRRSMAARPGPAPFRRAAVRGRRTLKRRHTAGPGPRDRRPATRRFPAGAGGVRHRDRPTAAHAHPAPLRIRRGRRRPGSARGATAPG